MTLTWFSALFVGCIIGWLIFIKTKIQGDKKHFMIKVPGTKLTLVIVILFFAAKYFFGYNIATISNTAEREFFLLLDLIASGTMTGITLGRSLNFLYKFTKAKKNEIF